MKISQTVQGITGMSSFHFTCWIFTKRKSFFITLPHTHIHTHTQPWSLNRSYQSAHFKPTNVFFFLSFFFLPLLLPSPFSSFYGLFCKALKIYKTRWARLVGGRLTNPGDSASLCFRGSKPYRSHQKDNNHSISFVCTIFLFSPLKRGENTNKYTLGYEHTIYTSTIKWKTGTTYNTFFSL